MVVRICKKPPAPTKRATVTLVKVKSCNVLLLVLLICILKDLKSVLSYKFLISDTYQPDTIFMWARMPGSLVIIRNQKGSASKKKFGKHSFNE